MENILLRTLLICLLMAMSLSSPAQRKREFRGAWIQCVNGQFQGLGMEKMKQTLGYQLDELKKDGVNAIIFQVRAECDALYPSRYEPWSRFLTGQQGLPPNPYWDPLKWMIDECHKRGMELHAWINPYRAKTKTTTTLGANHIALSHPEAVFAYDGQLILNPGMPENRDYICKVVDDIVKRYDVDGIHMDDYFYPYPVAGASIPDADLFVRYRGAANTVPDWRRDNVNAFVKQLSATIHKRKPWVKFGVSPFGIYRNKANDPDGSDTRGLQNYDDLYADVLLWVNQGWIDYCVPQIYWQIGHPTADYATLIQWWDTHATNRPLFIGEDVERTVKYADPQNPDSHQLPAKHALHEQMNHANGSVLWYAKAVVDNIGNYGGVLRTNYWRYPALTPLMPFLDNKAPNAPRKLKAIHMTDGSHMLFWTEPKAKASLDSVSRYVVYRFEQGEKINLDNPAKIQTVTPTTFFRLPAQSLISEKCTYVVTALDRVGNESKGKKVKVKL